MGLVTIELVIGSIAALVVLLIFRSFKRGKPTQVTYKGKKVILTGASSGIGEDLAYSYARLGAIVILAARRRDKLERVATKCQELGASDVFICTADVSKEEDCKSLILQTVKKYAGIDILVLNAGIGAIMKFEEIKDFKLVRQIFDTNYYGCIIPTYYALPYLRKSHGKVVVISSLAGLTGTPSRTIYCSTKHALHGFYESLRYEVSPDVQITVVCPGFVHTEFHDKVETDGAPLVRDVSQFMSSKECARIILQAEQKGKRLEVLTFLGKLHLISRLLLPDSIRDRIVAKKGKSL